MSVLGYVIVEFNQASGQPSLAAGGLIYDEDWLDQAFVDARSLEEHAKPRGERYEVFELRSAAASVVSAGTDPP